MDNQGFIFLHRKFLKWEWSSEPNMVALFIHILLSANYESKKWKGISIERGQFLTSLPSLSSAVGLSVQQVRTGLKRLVESGEITDNSTNKYRLITICKYDDYQPQNIDENRQSNRQTTGKQQTSNRQITGKQQQHNNINNIINNNIYSLSDEREHETEIAEDKPKKKTQGKKKEIDPYFNPLKETFMNFYSLAFNSEYYWEAKDSVAIKAISKKLQKAAKDKGLEESPENIAGNFKILLENITDKWILDRLSPPLINGKYNEIVSNIKNAKKHGKPTDNFRISFAPVQCSGTNEAATRNIDEETAAIEEWCRQNGLS